MGLEGVILCRQVSGLHKHHMQINAPVKGGERQSSTVVREEEGREDKLGAR